MGPNLYGLNPIEIWFPTQEYYRHNIGNHYLFLNIQYCDKYISNILKYHGKGISKKGTGL